DFSNLPPKIPYKHLIPLNEIIGEVLGKNSECQSVWELYLKFIKEFGPEFKLLMEVPVEELVSIQPEEIGRAIGLMRQGKVKLTPGYDGQYGIIRVLGKETLPGPGEPEEQLSLF
ncbi:MAG: DNA helicase UvrD, partial [Candidatus Saccharicenans sp.]